MIRAYEAEDLNAALNTWYSASQVGHPFLSETFFERERENMATRFLPRSETWVYERDGVVIGFISLSGTDVGGLFVDKAFQGQGVGRALVDHAKRDREVLELDVFEVNRVGRRFYERYGFRQVGEHICEETGFMQLRLRLEC